MNKSSQNQDANISNEIMQFVVFAIESAAQRMDISSTELYNRLEQQNLIENFLVDCYDTLHTQGKDYIANSVIETLHNWEGFNSDQQHSHLLVYHGSNVVVEHPIAVYGRDNLDFGKGFYVTTIKQQAAKWARQVGRRMPQATAILNIYDIDVEKITKYKMLKFENYDEKWLDFVVGNRTGLGLWKGFDIIVGGIANDKVYDTIEIYMSGQISKDAAIGRLKKEIPNNQLCFTNQAAIDCCLKYIGCEKI